MASGAVPPDDEELYLRLLDREEAALRDLVRRYRPNLMAALARYFSTLSREDHEEIVSDTFSRVWERIDSYDEKKAKFATWVFQITKNMAKDWRRSASYTRGQREETRADEYWTTVADDPPREVCEPPPDDPKVALVREALTHLTPDQREVITADGNCWPGQASTRELARWLGKTEGAIRVVRHRAHKKFRDALRKAGYSCEDPEEAPQ